MATIKSYTDLGQSKKLAEILPVESADMEYGYIAPYEFSDRMFEGGYDDVPYPKDFLKRNPNFSEDEYDGSFPCWSLAALRSLLPSSIEFNGKTYLFDSYKTSDGIWAYQYAALNESTLFYFKSIHDVDACYEMIICLHEQNCLGL